MTTTDSFLGQIGRWLVGMNAVPSGVVVAYSDSDDDVSGTSLVIDADEPQEHAVLDGVYSLSGSVRLSVSADDVALAERRAMLGAIEEAMRDDQIVAYIHALNEVLVYEIRVDGSKWEAQERRLDGVVSFNAVIGAV